MNKLLAVLIGSAFAFVSASALAQAPATKPVPTDNTLMPLSKMSTDDAKAARVAAKAKWDKMTPEEQAAFKKNMKAKKQEELSAMEAIAGEGKSSVYDAKAGAKAAAESKAQPMPTKAERQSDLKKAEDAAGKTGVGKSGVPTQ